MTGLLSPVALFLPGTTHDYAIWQAGPSILSRNDPGEKLGVVVGFQPAPEGLHPHDDLCSLSLNLAFQRGSLSAERCRSPAADRATEGSEAPRRVKRLVWQRAV